jgi:hypothetical protein
MGNEPVKTLKINCGLACLLNDREGILDAYEKIHINCGAFIATSAINAKLLARNAKINAGNMQVKEIKGKILQLDSNTVIDGKAGFKDVFILAAGNLVLKGEGMNALGEAEGAIVMGKLFYPDSGDPAVLARVNGDKRPYPEGAYVLLGDYDLDKAMAAAPGGSRHIWVSGKITALNRKALEDARAGELKITCGSLLIYEDFNGSSGDLFTCSDRELVPPGYEMTGSLKSANLPFYGPKLYVSGDFTLEAGDIPLLEKIESIIVKGRATLPASAAETFRKKGRAGSYRVLEGRLREINGFEQYSHGQLAESVSAGEKLVLEVNGCLLFDEDVTAEDTACIAALSYNGAVLVPAPVKAALASKVRAATGFMGDPALIEKMTGLNIRDFIAGHMGGDSREDKNKDAAEINTGTYLLI